MFHSNPQIYLDGINASWGTPESNQYHIQTDEGPERYFRYQTDNGQFRKEKRLQDGTVIGMYLDYGNIRRLVVEGRPKVGVQMLI